MAAPAQIAENYLGLWNADDKAVRVEMLAQGWTENATYADPTN